MEAVETTVTVAVPIRTFHWGMTRSAEEHLFRDLIADTAKAAGFTDPTMNACIPPWITRRQRNMRGHIMIYKTGSLPDDAANNQAA